MTTGDTVRYALAVVFLVSVPGAVLFWFAIHPFAAFWRRVGVGPAYVAGFGVIIGAGVAAFALRRPLLAADFGWNRGTALAGLLLLTFSAVIRHRWRKQLTISMLFGLPELAPGRFPPTLLSEGIYARVRHPRYLEFSLAAVGWALVCNYPAVYAAAGITIACIALLIPIEERELVARLGAAYEDYRRRVPAVVPRWRPRTRRRP
jgi:protein-S-isoprenylcysteine O-methyltransferase Ste14